MAIGKASDFKIYDEQIHSGLVETLVQETAVFNANSRGTIRLVSERLKGNYKYDAFFSNIASLVSRRDTTSVSAATDLAAAMGEFISVKLNRKIGPVAQTLDAFRKIGGQADVNSLSFLIGTQIAKAMLVDQVGSVCTALVAALYSNSTHNATNRYTVASSGTMATAELVNGLALMGDNHAKVKAWVMHSKPYFDLVKEQISAKITDVASVAVYEGSPVTLGRPVIVTDDAALKIASGTGTAATTDYATFGLVEGGAVVIDSEEEMIHAAIVTGLENLVVRLQGEFAYNLGLKGLKWDVANGGANPAAATLGTGTNWDAAASSYKDYPGVCIKSK